MDSAVTNPSAAHRVSERERLLRRLDNEKLSRFHWMATIVAGMGFLTDSYDLFVIGTVELLIGKDPSIAKSSIFAHSFAGNESLIGSTALIAAFLGAIIFGIVADRFGRRFIYGFELLVLAVGSICSALVPSLTWLIIARFILGIGIGGDYPVSATIISEHANVKNRGRLISTVFAMQAAGLVAGYIFALVVLGVGIPVGPAWRILLGLGAVPAILTFWLRRRMPESPRYLLHVKGDIAGARAAMLVEENGHMLAPTSRARQTSQKGHTTLAATRKRTNAARPVPVQPKWSWQILFTSHRFLLLLLGTAGAWFLMDYAYYGNTISSPLVIQRILGTGASAFQTTLAGFVVVAVAAVPGYILAISLMDRLGRKSIQMLGFAVMTVAYASIALIPAVRDNIALFAIAFGISYFFVEFGPNTTTFIYPAEVFPAAIRTTGHGFSAGFAKIGAFVGVLAFPLLEIHGLGLALGVAALMAGLGFLLTWILLPEPNQHSLEESERVLPHIPDRHDPLPRLNDHPRPEKRKEEDTPFHRGPTYVAR